MVMDTLLQSVLETIIKVLTPVAVMALIGCLAKGYQWLKQNVTSRQLHIADTIVNSLVQAAEELGLKDELMKAGDAKMSFVLNQAETFLSSKGINIDLDTLEMLAEKAVLTYFNWDKVTGDSNNTTQ